MNKFCVFLMVCAVALAGWNLKVAKDGAVLNDKRAVECEKLGGVMLRKANDYTQFCAIGEFKIVDLP